MERMWFAAEQQKKAAEAECAALEAEVLASSTSQAEVKRLAAQHAASVRKLRAE
eukprot:CAMPEP_0185852954 /NCGR_PEP_ID=MMETSP1354-20130828/17022_1 /TAXON_ID=708628 /ORGANISM="Erythrolobus madagascarensis, Strain CCMP3276" /LENGTH=53 /DNA_ID=CAMNT_0028554341 /DNA_START=17 /DNA_END=175 /DNA_ORIENTATION=+